MSKHILIVLDRLKNRKELADSLIEACPDWALTFCESGIEGLELLEKSRFDAVVADLDLPLLDGAQFLAEVMERQPKTLRFLLSDLSNKSGVMKCVGTAHQFVAKPCDTQTPKNALERSFSLDIWLPNEAVSALLSQMHRLPSPPALYFEVVKEPQRPNASLEVVGQLVARDPAMTAKILQLVNSAVFGFQRTIANPAEAVLFLGVDTTKSMLLLAHTYSYFEKVDDLGFSVDRFWQHCLTVGRFARWIAEAEQGSPTFLEEANTAGMLHDIGKLALVTNMPQRYRRVIQLMQAEKRSSGDAEREVFGATHAEVGACLLAIWGLSIPIVEALALHHLPMRLISEGLSPLTVVHAANAIEHWLVDPGSVLEVDTTYLTQIGFAERLPVWQDICSKRHRINDAL